MNPTAKRILYIGLVLIVLFIIIYPKLDLEEEKSPQVEAATSGPQDKTLTLNGVEVSYEPLNFDVKVTGSIIADESVALSSEVSAKVDGIYFKEGEQVEEGELLVSLSDDEIDAELEKQRFTQKLNEQNEYRQRRLLESEAISKEEYDIALTTLNTTLSDIKLLEVRKEKHQIKAPFSGVIGLRQISIGSYINPGQLIATIYKIDPIKLDFSIPGRYLQDINLGDKVKFTVDAYENEFEGEIYAIEPQIDPQTRSIRLRAICENAQGKLLRGQFAKITLILDEIEDAIMLPTEAVVPELNGTKVWVHKDGKVTSRQVTTGIRTAGNIQITNGLQPGDVVITSGLLQVRPGMEVKVTL
jgi:membrane fusion protein (multidrug efflux system)